MDDVAIEEKRYKMLHACRDSFSQSDQIFAALKIVSCDDFPVVFTKLRNLAYFVPCLVPCINSNDAAPPIFVYSHNFYYLLIK